MEWTQTIAGMGVRSLIRGRAPTSLWLAFLVAACGDSANERPRDAAPGAEDATTVADAARGDDGAPATDAGPSGESLVVTLRRGVNDEVSTPVEGAAVALDAPEGHRSEGVTDAAGHVVFDGIDWSLGLADVTSYVEGEALISVLGMDRRPELELLHLALEAVSHTEVTLSGALRNREAGFVTDITELASGAYASSTGDTYTLRVRAGVPLIFVVLQANRTPVTGGEDTELRWTVVHHDAVLDDTTLDLDLSQQEEPERVSGSIGVSSALEGLSWTIGATPGVGFVGRASRVRASPGLVEYDIEFLRVLGEDEVRFAVTGYYPFGVGPFTFARRRGYPRPGREDVELLEIPVIETPTLGASVGLHDVIRWRGPASELRIERGLDIDDPVLWRVGLPEGSTEIVLPRPPSAADTEAVLGTEPVVGRMWSSADSADGWELIAGSRYFELLP